MSEEVSNHRALKKPSFFWLATELNRALFEFGTYFPYKVLRNQEKTGDGHPVLVLPGFMATDGSTKPLRNFLNSLGYSSYGWGMGRNYGDIEYLDDLSDQVESLYRSHQQKVTIIGWSLGGIYARQIAKDLPHLTRQVVTLGSPFSGLTQPNNAVWLYNLLTNGKGTEEIDAELIADIPLPAPVPTTAIYSTEDGVVPWEACMEQIEDDIHQNIRVRGSHLGFGVNPVVLKILEDRLQYKEENWIKWDCESPIGDLIFYPEAKAVRA